MLRRTRRSSAEGRGSPKVETAKVAWRLRATEGRSLTLWGHESRRSLAKVIFAKVALPSRALAKRDAQAKISKDSTLKSRCNFCGETRNWTQKSRITLLYYRLCCFSFIRPLSCYFKKWDRTIVSLPFTFRNARVDWLLSKQQVERTTHIHWEWQELEDATSWGHVWRPWPRGARWAFRQKMSPTKVIFSTKVVYLVDLDLALLNLIYGYIHLWHREEKKQIIFKRKRTYERKMIVWAHSTTKAIGVCSSLANPNLK